MNIGAQILNHMSAGQNSLFGNGLMKSTAQRLERQAERDRQVSFIENQKKNLKNIECASPEEAGKILELLHSYEDQIAAVKAQYNNAQMFHLMDEAKERGEKIARAIEKSAPKTAEERKKEAVEEALGIDEEKGMLSEIMDKMSEEVLSQSLEDIPEMESEIPLDQEPAQAAELPPAEPEYYQAQEEISKQPVAYKRFNALV